MVALLHGTRSMLVARDAYSSVCYYFGQLLFS
jgi:hypothetical protein